jgi:transcriptional regulator with XRE-family HTH domain
VATARETVLRRFGKRIRQVRKGKGVTQEALANSAGIDRAYMSGIELGRHNPGILHVYKIARALKVSPKELLPE